MANETAHRLITKDPVSGCDLDITEVSCEDSGVTIRGRFEMPRWAKLEPEQERFLETFLRCRGMINSVERELGISYPTVKSRLDALLNALEIAPIKEKKEKGIEKKRKILDMLERGEITADQAKEKIKAGL